MWLVNSMSGSDYLWPVSQLAFRQVFQTGLRRLGLHHIRLTPDGLRPGGATFFFMKCMSIPTFQLLGLRRSFSSLEAYVQEATCNVTSDSIRAFSGPTTGLKEVVSYTVHVWNTPPVLPCRSLFPLRKRR